MNKVTLNPDKLTFVEIMTLLTAISKGRLAEVYGLAQKAVVAWSYEIDHEKPDAILELGIAESSQVINTVINTLGSYAERLAEENLEETVEVNWSGIERDGKRKAWSTKDFLDFSALGEQGKWDKVERMMLQVAEIEGAKSPLSASQGLMMKTAIQNSYAKAIQGKN